MWKDCVLRKKVLFLHSFLRRNIINIKDNETYISTIETQESKQTRF